MVVANSIMVSFLITLPIFAIVSGIVLAQSERNITKLIEEESE